jgi:hypothetical protein
MARRLLGHVKRQPVAFVALFFALSGGALAANNYIRSTDIVSAGDLAGSTYGAPLIKSGAVGSDKLANESVTTLKFDSGAQAPNAAKLGGTPASDYLTTASGDSRYLPLAGTAADSAKLDGQAPSAFAAASLFGGPASFSQGITADQSCILGEIKLFAGTPPSGDHLADGSLLPIGQYPALFEVLDGPTYGGDGRSTFALPDLRGAEPKGRGPAGVSYYICVFGVFP